VAGRLTAFFHTSNFRDDGLRHHGQRGTRLVPMTADTRELIGAALRCVEAAWPGERGCRYVKAGVLLDDLCRPEDAPRSLFAAPPAEGPALMAAMDRINAKYGRGTVFPAAMGIERSWKLRAAYHSPRYTTRVEELPRVRA
jgi:DNA polymerase V